MKVKRTLVLLTVMSLSLSVMAGPALADDYLRGNSLQSKAQPADILQITPTMCPNGEDIAFYTVFHRLAGTLTRSVDRLIWREPVRLGGQSVEIFIPPNPVPGC